MALIRCPECGNSISDRAEKCPHCGLPASYFSSLSKNTPHMKEAGLDYKNLQNVLISFERDHAQLFSAEHYISHRDAQRLRDTYGKYNESLTNKLIFQYVCNNAAAIRVDIDSLRRFLRQMQSLDGDITAHNTTYVDRALERDKDYFDNILKQIDPNIQLDEEQRRAVITDDDYCLLVAGAGAGKTTTMAAKVKYLVEKKSIDPGEIIVISYTNKAIGELRDRINKGLGIPAKICSICTAFRCLHRIWDRPNSFRKNRLRSIFLPSRLFLICWKSRFFTISSLCAIWFCSWDITLICPRMFSNLRI